MTKYWCKRCNFALDTETKAGWHNYLNLVISKPSAGKNVFGFYWEYDKTHRECGGPIIVVEG